MKTVFASLVVLSAVLVSAHALDCFKCNSQEDPACGDEFQTNSTALQNAFVYTCPEHKDKNAPFCRKMRMNIYEPHEIRIQRDCGYEKKDSESECYQKRSDDYIIDICECDDDLCNAAPALTLAPVLALILPFLARAL